MRERYQGGSLAGFIIIGVLLMLVLAGGLYGLNRYNAERANEEVAQNDTGEETATENEPATEESGSQTDTSTATDGQTRTDASEERTDTSGEATEEATATDELPATGPSDSLALMLVVAASTYGVVYALRSRA